MNCNAFTEERQRKARFTMQCGEPSLEKERKKIRINGRGRERERQALKVVWCRWQASRVPSKAGEQGLWVEEADWMSGKLDVCEQLGGPGGAWGVDRQRDRESTAGRRLPSPTADR